MICTHFKSKLREEQFGHDEERDIKQRTITQTSVSIVVRLEILQKNVNLCFSCVKFLNQVSQFRTDSYSLLYQLWCITSNMRPIIFFLSFYLLSFSICRGLLYIYNNIVKIIALQLLQREQASLLFRMVHVVTARSPSHVDPTSTFYGILFSTLGFSDRGWIFY